MAVAVVVVAVDAVDVVVAAVDADAELVGSADAADALVLGAYPGADAGLGAKQDQSSRLIRTNYHGRVRHRRPGLALCPHEIDSALQRRACA